MIGNHNAVKGSDKVAVNVNPQRVTCEKSILDFRNFSLQFHSVKWSLQDLYSLNIEMKFIENSWQCLLYQMSNIAKNRGPKTYLEFLIWILCTLLPL